MQINDKGLALLKGFEGLKLVPYLDVAGKPTIGFGHLIKEGESFTVITEAEATALLQADVAATEEAINKLVTVDLTSNQFSALVCLVYNIGSGNFEHSTILDELNEGEYDLAAKEFAKWIRSGGVIIQGLINRRFKEQQLFLEPDS